MSGRKSFGTYIPVCVLHDSNCRNHPIFLKFGTNVYELCEIGCIVFGVLSPNSAYTGIH